MKVHCAGANVSGISDEVTNQRYITIAPIRQTSTPLFLIRG